MTEDIEKRYGQTPSYPHVYNYIVKVLDPRNVAKYTGNSEGEKCLRMLSKLARHCISNKIDIAVITASPKVPPMGMAKFGIATLFHAAALGFSESEIITPTGMKLTHEGARYLAMTNTQIKREEFNASFNEYLRNAIADPSAVIVPPSGSDDPVSEPPAVDGPVSEPPTVNVDYRPLELRAIAMTLASSFERIGTHGSVSYVNRVEDIYSSMSDAAKVLRG